MTIWPKLLKIFNPPSDFSIKNILITSYPKILNLFYSYWYYIEAPNIISSLNLDKIDGSNRISTRILKLSNKDISDQLAFLFNFLPVGYFFQFWKQAKLHRYRRSSKRECSNYRPISFLSNIDKILERLMYIRIYSFTDKNSYV